MDLKNRVAIVTGGARGIGLAIVEDLRAHGANVVIVDAGVSIAGEPLDPQIAEQVAARIEGTVALCGDIAEPATAPQAVRVAQERFGSVDIVVNNAAIIRDAFIFKAEPAAWDAVLRTNLTGAYRLLAAASPVMREQAKTGRAPGSIVNIVSTAGFYGNFGQVAYAAAKAGLMGLTRSWRMTSRARASVATRSPRLPRPGSPRTSSRRTTPRPPTRRKRSRSPRFTLRAW